MNSQKQTSLNILILFFRDSNWCLTCAALISPKCQKEHTTVFIDSGKIAEAEALQSLMDSYKSNLVEAIAKREDIDKDLNGLLCSIEKIVEELKGDIETNEIEIAVLASMLTEVENQHGLEVSVQSLKEKLQTEVEVSKNSLRLANDAMILNFLRVRIDLRNTANESVPVCARFANGIQYAKNEIKNRPGLRSKLNLINHLVVSVNREELKLTKTNEATFNTAEKTVTSSKLLSTAECSSTQSLPSIGSDVSTCTTNDSISTNKLISLPHFVSSPTTSFIIRARKAKEILGEITIQTSFDQIFVNALSELCRSKPVISNHVTQVCLQRDLFVVSTFNLHLLCRWNPPKCFLWLAKTRNFVHYYLRWNRSEKRFETWMSVFLCWL